MTTAPELAEAVRRAVADQPYMVTDQTPDGFTVQIDVVDQQWWTLMYRKSLSTTFAHVVRVDPATSTYTVTDKAYTVSWEAGVDVGGGIPRPTLRASASTKQGIVREKSFRKEYGMDDDGNVGAAVDYSFDSAEGNRLIDAEAQRLGLTKKMNTTAKVGLVVAAVAVGGLLLAGIVTLVVLLLTGVIG
ncbi:hypothetical protein RDV89_06120 [Nocardioides zeae]|uniref:Uncharacterized protein n=1 Tax=Nocardioides imazamoxiresistens TaxID=3231893 RepID=A0ABU3PUV9_9ACTN|nr:hypothetical protein [Nocardioides zeae]MDT9592632.1 hypothetical protein [Nocardioides zeae]